MPQPVSTTNPPANQRQRQRQRCEVWTRVMGYHRPVSSFNPGKQAEFHERQYFLETRFTDPAEQAVDACA